MPQVALITGSSRGIGLATARALAGAGFAVALNAPDMDDELCGAVSNLQAEGAVAMAVAFDVCRTDLHDEQLAVVESRLGALTTLVNNAGVGVLHRGDLLEASEESFDRCFAVNARAPFFLSQAFARRLLARDRDSSLYHSIINVSSANASAVAVQRSEYCASKAALAMISKAFAVRLGADDIAVHDVQPGLIDTDMTAPVIALYRQRAAEGLTLLPRVGTPAEVGKIIASVASGQLPYTTGQVISADGGMLVPRF